MSFRHFHIFLLGLLACALAALAMLLPSWLGAYVAAQGTPERNAERAAADFLPLLEEQWHISVQCTLMLTQDNLF